MRRTGWCDVVGLIDHQHVKFARVARVYGENVTKHPERLSRFEPVHRGNEARKRRPGIGVNATVPAQLFNVLRVDDLEFQPELFDHLHAPLLLK